MAMRVPILTMMAGAMLLLGGSAALAQQSAGQQKCLNGLNKDGAVVARTQGQENVGCLKGAGTGKLVGSAQTCLAADTKGKVGKAKSKTTADETKSCAPPPDFGYTSAAAINTAAVQAELDLTADVYGANLEAAVLLCDTDKPGCACQQKISKSVEQLAAVKLSAFVSCKKAALKNGATAAAALAACVNDAGTAGSIAADNKGKIAKTLASLNAAITKSCDGPGVTAGAFPGSCILLAGGALGACLDTRVECRVCQAINAIDGLFVNCDLFDDGLANASCASGTGPTPTPTPTSTPTPTLTPPPALTPTPTATLTPPPALTPTPTVTLTPTPTVTATPVPGPGFKGALGPPSTGLFNYAGVGIPGSNTACNTNFPGSHTCTYAELQTWDAVNQLIGAVDTNATPVTSFWAIDSAQPGTRQCDNPVPWGYATAHTGHFGDKVPLTAGHLGALLPSQICATTSWVGCCE